jgi:phenylacetate-coenzyme A ligase PaaK-like adenylate-forming protein
MTLPRPHLLADLLEHARTQTAYGSALLGPAAGATPESAPGLLAGLPVLTRADLRREGFRLQARQGDTGTWRLLRTTGTTAEPAEVVLDAGARAAEALSLAAHVRRCLGSDDWRARDLLHLALHGGASSRAMPSPWHPQARVVKWNLLQAWQAGDDAFVRCLSHLDGRVVTALPSVAELLASRLTRTAPGRIRPLLVLLSGEALEAQTRARVAEAFGCPVSSLYTLAEAGIVGTECLTDGGYHVEDSVWVEILDDQGLPAPPGVEGDIVLTPLANRAMVLLRYRCGDRGCWLPQPCRCGRAAPCLRLSAGRRPARLLSAAGATVNVVRFAKLLAALEVERWHFHQDASGAAGIDYQAGRPLPPAAASVVASAVRAALGPQIEVRLRRVPSLEQAPSRAEPPSGPASARSAEPAGPDLGELVRWLRGELGEDPDLEAAVLTGSALDPEAATRFSDVDLVLLVRGDPGAPRWVEEARRLRLRVPRLAVTVDARYGLERRAPLLVCRLHCEQALVAGRLDESLLPWPVAADLRAAGRFWAQEAEAILWHRLTRPDPPGPDLAREAALAARHALDALRYRYLLRGARVTATREVLALAHGDADLEDVLVDVEELFDLAREHRPPAGPEALARGLAAARGCVRAVAADLDPAR